MNQLIEHHALRGHDVEVHREDQRIGKPYVPHGKTPSICALIASLAFERRFNESAHAGISCFASRGSDWALNAAIAAHTANLKLTIYTQHPSKKALQTPSTAFPEFINKAVDEFAAHVAFVDANHTQIMISQARKRATAQGDFFIPFGFEMPLCMRELTDRLTTFDQTASVVLCAGSGITLVCLLRAALLVEHRFKRVIAVSSGRSEKAISSTVARHLSELDLSCCTEQLDIYAAESDYGPAVIETPWPTHPFYDRKAFAWLDRHVDELRDPIAFLNM